MLFFVLILKHSIKTVVENGKNNNLNRHPKPKHTQQLEQQQQQLRHKASLSDFDSLLQCVQFRLRLCPLHITHTYPSAVMSSSSSSLSCLSNVLLSSAQIFWLCSSLHPLHNTHWVIALVNRKLSVHTLGTERQTANQDGKQWPFTDCRFVCLSVCHCT